MDTMREQEPLQAEDSQAVTERADKLQLFGRSLAATRDDWIRARAATGWDKRASEDLDQYHGVDNATRMASAMMDSVQQGFPVTTRQANPTRSTVFVGVTRQKTNAAEARLTDILLPTDDKNWGIQPTPDPDGARAMVDDGVLVDPATGQPVLFDEQGNVTEDPELGRPARKKDVALASQRAAATAAKAMQQEIDDQLVECDYNSELRKMIHDSAVMGTGVVCGPLVTKRTRKAWLERRDPASGQKVHELQVVEELKPSSVRKDPRYVWEDPACGDDVQNGSGIFELNKLTEKKVRLLARQPGYMKEQLLQVLEQGPKRSAALYELERKGNEKDGQDESTLYSHWIYWGELKREDLELAGVEVPEDELEIVSACVEMINDVVVRAYMNPLEDGALPYDFFPWEKVQGSVRGQGVPRLMKAQQSVINAAWRQMMDNAGVTSGPQIVVKRTAITPADGQWTLSPRKFWFMNDESQSAQNVFQAVEFNSHQAELSAIIELAEKLSDQETGTPMMAQGQQGSAPETVGGMQLLMNNSNVVTRRLVKQFDDYVTRKHIRRYYDFNMAYSDKQEIKGDFQVDARGSSALMVRDIQNQAYTNMLAAAGSPMYAPFVDPKQLFERVLRAQHIDPRDIMYAPEKIEENLANAQQQTDPRVQAAQINADARMKQADAVARGRATEMEVLRESETENRRMRLLELQLKHDLALMEMANTKQMTIDQIKAQLANTAITARTKKELAASEMAFKDQKSPDGQGI